MRIQCMRNRIAISSCLMAVVLFAMTGCENRTQVTGTVLMDGQPVADAAVSFHGEGPASVGTTDSEGKFVLKFKGEDLIPPGSYNVSIMKFERDAAAEGKTMEAGAGAAAGVPLPGFLTGGPMKQPKNLLPKKYQDPKSSGLTAEVKRGMDPLEFTLTND